MSVKINLENKHYDSVCVPKTVEDELCRGKSVVDMKTTIEWKTGTPDEYGEYLTVRKSRRDGSIRVDVNTYATDELMKNGPLPETWRQGWQIFCADGCDIVAWTKIKDIKVEE